MDDFEITDELQHEAPALMVLVENIRESKASDEKILIGILSVIPSTGDVVYDQFQGRAIFITPFLII